MKKKSSGNYGTYSIQRNFLRENIKQLQSADDENDEQAGA
jgi:hypothetical protein